MGKRQRRREREAAQEAVQARRVKVRNMPQLCPIRVDGEDFAVSHHAGRRWEERVRKAEGTADVALRRDIQTLAQFAHLVHERPEWQQESDYDPRTEAWIMFGPDIAMPICDGVATTTLARGYLSDEARSFRNRTRRANRAGKRMAAKSRKARNDTPGRDFGDKLRLTNKRQRNQRRAASG